MLDNTEDDVLDVDGEVDVLTAAAAAAAANNDAHGLVLTSEVGDEISGDDVNDVPFNDDALLVGMSACGLAR